MRHRFQRMMQSGGCTFGVKYGELEGLQKLALITFVDGPGKEDMALWKKHVADLNAVEAEIEALHTKRDAKQAEIQSFLGYLANKHQNTAPGFVNLLSANNYELGYDIIGSRQMKLDILTRHIFVVTKERGSNRSVYIPLEYDPDTELVGVNLSKSYDFKPLYLGHEDVVYDGEAEYHNWGNVSYEDDPAQMELPKEQRKWYKYEHQARPIGDLNSYVYADAVTIVYLENPDAEPIELISAPEQAVRSPFEKRGTFWNRESYTSGEEDEAESDSSEEDEAEGDSGEQIYFEIGTDQDYNYDDFGFDQNDHVYQEKYGDEESYYGTQVKFDPLMKRVQLFHAVFWHESPEEDAPWWSNETEETYYRPQITNMGLAYYALPVDAVLSQLEFYKEHNNKTDTSLNKRMRTSSTMTRPSNPNSIVDKLIDEKLVSLARSACLKT